MSDKTSHSQRLEEGFFLSIVLAFIGAICWISYRAIIEWAIPHGELVLKITVGLTALTIVWYVLGYLKTDFMDDLNEWLDD